MGQFVETEVQNAQGRADCVVRTQDTIYLFEFKLWSTGTPADALAQIKEKGYAVPYLSSELVRVSMRKSATLERGKRRKFSEQ